MSDPEPAAASTTLADEATTAAFAADTAHTAPTPTHTAMPTGNSASENGFSPYEQESLEYVEDACSFERDYFPKIRQARARVSRIKNYRQRIPKDTLLMMMRAALFGHRPILQSFLDEIAKGQWPHIKLYARDLERIVKDLIARKGSYPLIVLKLDHARTLLVLLAWMVDNDLPLNCYLNNLLLYCLGRLRPRAYDAQVDWIVEQGQIDRITVQMTLDHYATMGNTERILEMINVFSRHRPFKKDMIVQSAILRGCVHAGSEALSAQWMFLVDNRLDTTEACSVAIRAFADLGNWGAVDEVYRHLVYKRHKANNRLLSTVWRALRNNLHLQLKSFWELCMCDQPFPHDAPLDISAGESYADTMQTYFDRWSELVQLKNQQEKEKEGIERDRLLGRKLSEEEVDRILTRRWENHIRRNAFRHLFSENILPVLPTHINLQSMLLSFADAGDWKAFDAVRGFMESTKDEWVAMRADTHDRMVQAFWRNGRSEDALHLLDVMHFQDYPVSSPTWRLLNNSLMKTKDPELARRFISVLPDDPPAYVAKYAEVWSQLLLKPEAT